LPPARPLDSRATIASDLYLVARQGSPRLNILCYVGIILDEQDRGA
jgi:hypothetical protein